MKINKTFHYFAIRQSRSGLQSQNRTLFIILIAFFQIFYCRSENCNLGATNSSNNCGDDTEYTNLHTLKLEDGGEFLAYVRPDVDSFYKLNGVKWSKKTQTKPKFNGVAGKFINLSKETVRYYWDSGGAQDANSFNSVCKPFNSCGTATFPGHSFYITPNNDAEANIILQRITVQDGECLYMFDPYDENIPQSDQSVKRYGGDSGLKRLNSDEREQYFLQKQNIDFARQYKAFTGADWLTVYTNRDRPSHKMWPADHFGQDNWVTSKETHFVKLPPKNLLEKVPDTASERRLGPNDPRPLADYRSSQKDLNMKLTALSIAPRAFEIKNFLSKVEVAHIIQLAAEMNLAASSVGDSGHGQVNKSTRTSRNTWVYREQNPIIDAIYRRAADLMRIDEALFRRRDKDEFPDLESKGTISEPLQLVHYDIGQQYTAHHDFGYSKSTTPGQPARFATLLLYLNEPMEGGETTFPRWVNGHTRNELKVIPEIGKAVLFYSALPDGNFDDLSQHSAAPVKKGEKWLINLWVWDPYMN